MIAYIIRRVLLGIPTVIGVCLITFFLFYLMVPPREVARKNLGSKSPTQAQINQWLEQHGYNKPPIQQFEGFMVELATFHFGNSDVDNEPINEKIKNGAGPSLTLAVPEFIASLLITIPLSVLLAYYRGTYLDTLGTFLAVLLMSLNPLVYIIAGQYIFGIELRLAPIMGFAPGLSSIRFIVMPLVIGVLAGLGGSVRFYRTVMLEEIGQDYVRTARAKGLGEGATLLRHVVKNAMIPILTSVVMSLPFLFMGSVLMESFFGIPGLGSITIDAINSSDFSVLRVMVYIGSLLYILGIILTDISYTLVDPRVRLGE
ncbi:MAG: ABC transporter permease [Armatimonadota bacterium]|nr:ABC transporter permease [Armatimonadota bacterium]